MKIPSSLLTTTAAAALWLAGPFPAVAADLNNADEIVERSNLAAYYAGDDGRSQVRMPITDGQGRQRLRQFTILRRNAAPGGDQQFLVLFSQPADVRRTTFLVHKHLGGDDDRWLYLPGLDLVKRIAAGDQRTSFVGSHFYYEDISGRAPAADRHELVETTVEHYVVKHTPKDPASVEFANYTTWIDKQTLLPMRAEYTDVQGQTYRRMTNQQVEMVDGHPTPLAAQIEDLASGGKTEIQFRGIEYDLGIPESAFVERSLRNPPMTWFQAGGALVLRFGPARLAAGGALAALVVGAWPVLAAGADDWADDWADDGDAWAEPAPVAVHGFAEAALGSRVQDHAAHANDLVLHEARVRLDLSHERDRARFSVKSDAVADAVLGQVEIDVREALVYWRAADGLDLSVGRQVLTWGTGDLVFLNDLFPKDYVSFFAGRADEFLKAPANSVKASLYVGGLSWDLVWTPIFGPDRIITGERLGFYDPATGAVVGGGRLLDPREPTAELRHGEGATRIKGYAGSWELAAYGYLGYSKQPTALDAATGRPTYARLAVYGASLRGPLAGGIANIEGALHDSLDDRAGRDPRLPNSQLKALAGYERELAADLSMRLQYLVDHTWQHAEAIAASPRPELVPDEWAHTATARLRYSVLRQTLVLGVFGLVGISANEVYLRPQIAYKATDQLELSIGGNVMFGDHTHTQFAQLSDDSNAYARLRYSF